MATMMVAVVGAAAAAGCARVCVNGRVTFLHMTTVAGCACVCVNRRVTYLHMTTVRGVCV